MKTLKLAKRLMAVVLVLALTLVTPITAFAADFDFEGTPKLYEGPSIINKGIVSTENKEINTAETKKYEPNDVVNVIVQLESDPLLGSEGNVVAIDDIKDGAGEAQAEDILAEQQVLINKLDKIISGELKVLAQFTAALNAVAVECKYSEIESIRAIDGVKAVAISGKISRPEPLMATANDMTGVYNTWASGYTGAGTLIAVIDTGLELSHEIFQTAPADAWMTESYLQMAINYYGRSLMAVATSGSTDAADFYKSAKVPFAYDYIDSDTNVSPDPSKGSADVAHGTHVAGIAAGYKATEEGEIEFAGVAPNAQVAVMKVFSEDEENQGAYTIHLLMAIQDAVLIGADVINMSLGSSNGYTISDSGDATEDNLINGIYNLVKQAGVNLMVSAGNENNSAVGNTYRYGMNLTEDPDNGIVGSPSTYASALSVASINNTYAYKEFIYGADREITFALSNDTENTFKGLIPEGEESLTLEYVAIPGVGAPEDFDGIDVEGKVALIQRGELNFGNKIKNAADKGAIGVIVYDNVETVTYVNMSVLEDAEGNKIEQTIPGVFISLADGEALIAAETKEVTFYKEGMFVEDVTTGAEMSEFSSWGVPNNLTLKPEITAPGGNIYSSVPGNSYESYSGTSMAAPHMAGAAAIVKEYIYDLCTENELMGGFYSYYGPEELINALLMSTAVPVVEEDVGAFYSPRKQGSGLVNVAAATTTEAFLMADNIEIDGSLRPKLNLGSSEDGEYTLQFMIVNFSDEEQTYDVSTVAQMPAVGSDGIGFFMRNFDWVLDATATDTVTVAAGDSAMVTLTLNLSEDDKAAYGYYPNGAYMEGFVFVENTTDETAPELSLPFLGFYGNWTDASVLDKAAWYEVAAADPNGYPPYSVMYHQAASDVYIGGEYINSFLLGANVLTDSDVPFQTKNFVISPNDDGWFDTLSVMGVGQLRNADLVTYSIADENGEEIYHWESKQNFKSYYHSGYQQAVAAYMFYGYNAPEFEGTDAEGNVLPSGTTVNVSITADLIAGDGSEDYDLENNTWTFPLTIDTEEPAFEGYRHVVEDGRIYLEGVVSDDVSAMQVSVYPAAFYGYNQLPLINTDIYAESPVDGEEDIFKVDITDLLIFAAENDRFDDLWIEVYDYGYNYSPYIIDAIDIVEDLHLVDFRYGADNTIDAELLNVGESVYLYAVENFEEANVEWATDNEAVATVEDGVVTAVAPGTALVTATNADGVVAKFIVGVREEYGMEYFGINYNHSITAHINEPVEPSVFLGEFEYYGVTLKHIEWKSMDESIATVDENGVITTVGEGYTMVVASFAMQSQSGIVICDAYVGVHALPDRTALGELIEDCLEEIDPDDYPDTHIKEEYLAALEEAIEVYNDDESTAEEILAAYWRLKRAKQILQGAFDVKDDGENIVIGARPEDAEEENPNTGAEAPSAVAAIAVLGAAAYVLGKKR